MIKFLQLWTIPLIISLPKKNHQELRFHYLLINSLKKRHQVLVSITMNARICSPINQESYLIDRLGFLSIKLMGQALHNILLQTNLLKNL